MDTNHTEPQQPQQPQETMGSGGLDIGPAIAHAIFLDLPEPWLAIPHAASTLRPNGTIASYSPCVEQSKKNGSADEGMWVTYGEDAKGTAERALYGYIIPDRDPVPRIDEPGQNYQRVSCTGEQTFATIL